VHAVLTRSEALTSSTGLKPLQDAVWPATQTNLPHPVARGAKKAIPLVTLIDRACQDLEPQHTQRDIEIDLHDGSLALPLDSEPLIHALRNVIENACRFSSHTSRVRVRSRQDWADGFDRVVLMVCDRGIGMTRAHQQHAFEAHWQATPREYSQHNPSAGMGLTVARQLVETQGGWLEMRSALGIGTEVELWLPAPISADRLA